jgi:hypothetical protein
MGRTKNERIKARGFICFEVIMLGYLRVVFSLLLVKSVLALSGLVVGEVPF